MESNSQSDARDAAEQRDDLLSFLSLFLSTHQSATTDMWASQVLLDRFIPWLRNPTGAGSSFEVHVVGADVLQKGLHAALPAKLFDGRESVALKRPIMTGDRASEVDHHIWASLATEFRILANPLLGCHPNIVKLLGNVWQSAGAAQATFAPVLVLEAASGNLKELYSSSGPGIKLYEAIELFSGIAFGLHALHKCGVIHGDLKPENILIFRDNDGSCTAKLADFGSSVILRDMQSSVRLSGGTEYWRAPEYNDTLLMSDLIAVEIYSFGLLMLDFFVPGMAQESQKHLRDIVARGSTSESAHELLQGLAYELISDTYDLEQLAQLIRQCLMVAPSMRPQTMEDVIERLQDLLGASEVDQEDSEPTNGE
ncbi:hypothetical protein GP486_004167 [Trichoglossum hirsutum]|uniref:Protein kinase domain-containing protein n=1 Tax=Trichoglossum hirsutum TaxID=265104 RepID=A0A9P8RPK8_9PEZI|nr:hypothetical protein GP486_004167 [Trichoglossum hirsutum]